METNIKIDELLYIEIKAAQEDDVSSSATAEELELPLDVVNKVYASPNYFQFCKGVDVEKPQDLELKESKVLKSGQPGFLRGTLAKGKDVATSQTTSERAKQLKTLNDQIQSSWAMITLLEKRKSILQNEIEKMENYIRAGLQVVEKYIEK